MNLVLKLFLFSIIAQVAYSNFGKLIFLFLFFWHVLVVQSK